jgi:hypothetical protein
VAGNVNDFADEEEARHAVGFHGFAGEFAGVHAAGGDFGFFVAFGGSRSKSPGVELLFKSGEGRIGEGGRGVEFEPALGETIGEKFLEGFASTGEIAAAGRAKWSGGVSLGSEIESDGLALFPVGRDLKYGGTAEASVREEHFFAEGMSIGGGDDFGGDAGEFGVAVVIGATEDERNEAGSRGNDVMAKLAGEVVAKGSSAHLRDGKSPSCDDEGGRAKLCRIGAKQEFSGALDFRDAGVDENLDARGAAFGFEQIDDFRGGIVTKELTESFFVPGNAMFISESNEIVGRETGKGGFGKVGIGGNKVFRRGMNVREIAATTAGDENFLPNAVGVFDDGHAAAAFARLDGAKEACGACAKN